MFLSSPSGDFSPSLEVVLIIFLLVSFLIFVLATTLFQFGLFPALTLALIAGYVIFLLMYPPHFLRYQESVWMIVLYLFVLVAIPVYLFAYIVIVSCSRHPLNPPAKIPSLHRLATKEHGFLEVEVLR